MKPAFEIDTCIIEENKKKKEKSFGTTTGSHVLLKKKKKKHPTAVHLYRTSPVLNPNLAQLQV